MSSTNVLKIGLDPGYGSIKVAMVNGKVDTFSLPSVVGVGVTEAGAIDLAGLGDTRRAERPHQISTDDGQFLVGANVASYTRPIERMDFGRFTDGPELRAMVYTALAQLNVAGSQLGLVVGLPVEMLRVKSEAEQTATDIKAWLMGRHRFTLDGQEIAFEVVSLRADVAQPLGAWLDWGLNDEGKWGKGPKGRAAPVLIIDQGFNTLDLFAIKEGKPSQRYTDGETLGMRRAAELISQQVTRQFEVPLSLHEADSLLQQHLAGQPVSIYVHGDQIKITTIIKQALDNLSGEVIQFIERVTGKAANEFRIIMTGGGALALAPRLQRQYHHAEMAPQPVVANARGLAKLALTSLLD